MSFELDINQSTRSLGNLELHDIIEYESPYISRDLFMVTTVDKDQDIPALLLQLWRLEGGYNHAFKNVMENDLGINSQVPFFEPEVQQGEIIEITSYRPLRSNMSRKEELFFDVWPEITSETPDDRCDTPFKANVRIGSKVEEMIVPSWTPLQKLPIDRIATGTIVEVWEVNSISNIMKIVQI